LTKRNEKKKGRKKERNIKRKKERERKEERKNVERYCSYKMIILCNFIFDWSASIPISCKAIQY
jgi:hypothetical protein